MKKIGILCLVILLAACVTTKPDEKTFVGVEKQELPDEFKGNPDQTNTSSADTSTQQEDGGTVQPDQEGAIQPVPEDTGEPPVQEGADKTQEASEEIIVVTESDTEVTIVLDESEDQDAVVVETQSNAVSVPETSLVTIRSTDAERLGVIFADMFALRNYENMLKTANTLDVTQVIILCNSNNQAVYTELFLKLQDAAIKFYLLFSDYMVFYRNREIIKNNSSIKGVIFWYEYWNFIQFNYKSRTESFEEYLKQLNIVSATAKQYGLMCYTIVDWFTIDELKQILAFPLLGLLLAVNDKRIGIAEYIDTNIQLVRSTGIPVYWGIFLNYKPGYNMNTGTDNDVIKLMKLYRDDPRFQGIIFLY